MAAPLAVWGYAGRAVYLRPCTARCADSRGWGRAMQRRIVDYGTDQAGEPIAVLDCGHPQHIRDNPPFINRPWIHTEQNRGGMLGTVLECMRCEEEPRTWRSLALGDGLLAEGPLREIEEAFATAFADAGRPLSMAVWKRHDLENSLHCEVSVYFSPGADSVARAFDARPCAKPARANLELLGGDARSWEVLL
jgi:hypothetical protein